jgi:predicted dehydrogenase
MDMGGHCIDLLEMFFGPVQSVSCSTRCAVHKYRSEDSALASLQFKNGALGVVDTFFCIPDVASQNRLELYGSGGSILASGTIGQGDRGEMIAWLAAEPAEYDSQQERTSESGLPITPAPSNPYRAEIEEFSQAILDQREPMNDGELGLRSQRVLAACYESAQTCKVVPVGHPLPSDGRGTG